MIKVGTVKTINESNCTVRVLFEETGQMSAELQVTQRGTRGNKSYWLPEIEEQVLCAFTDQHVGYVLSSPYSEIDPPPISTRNKRHTTFKDGTIIEYDTETSTLFIDAKGPIHIKATGNINVEGDVIADGISLKNHSH